MDGRKRPAACVSTSATTPIFTHTRAFVETSLELSVQARNALSAVEVEAGMRPAFLGHLLTEVLLDAALDRRASCPA